MREENKLEKFLVNREELNQRYRSSKYKSLKYTALGFFIAVILLFAIMIITMDNLSDWWYLFMRGCAGVLAIIGVIFYAVYVFRINRDFERGKYLRKVNTKNYDKGKCNQQNRTVKSKNL